jgi:hypothetical protein
MYQSGIEIPRISFSSLDPSEITVGSFYIGFNLDTGGKLTKMDHLGNLTVLEGESLPYKAYTAKLTQVGTNDPSESIFYNGLDAFVTWTRVDVGQYLATFSQPFVNAQKIAIFINQSGSIPLGGGDSVFTYAYINGVDTIALETLVSSNFSDDQLFETSIEIRDYA